MPSEKRNAASIGSWIKVKEHGEDEEELYHLTQVTNVQQNKLAPDNPMGKALIGARPGDDVTVHGPAGSIRFSVVDVGHDDKS